MTEYEKHLATLPPIDRWRPWRDNPATVYPSYCSEPKYTSFRDEAVKRFAWAILDAPTVGFLSKLGPFVEIGSGNGYWAHELRQVGVDIIPTDPGDRGYSFDTQWCDVLPIDAPVAASAHPDRTLLIVWPSYSEPWAADALRAYRGGRVVYVGEGDGGCTGDDAFHSELSRWWEEVNRVHIPQWDMIHDTWGVYERSGQGGCDEG